MSRSTSALAEPQPLPYREDPQSPRLGEPVFRDGIARLRRAEHDATGRTGRHRRRCGPRKRPACRTAPRRIKHLAKVYVDGDAHTQTVEGFFGLFKNGVRGVYHAISVEYLQDYLNEYAFRYNRRFSDQPMFWAILDEVQKDRLSAAA